MLPFYALTWDINHRKVEFYDIMPYLIDVWKGEKKRKNKVFCKNGMPDTLDGYKDFILSACQYQFWSRCEYEIVVDGFPPFGNAEKIDVYRQVKENIHAVALIFKENIEKKKKKNC